MNSNDYKKAQILSPQWRAVFMLFISTASYAAGFSGGSVSLGVGFNWGNRQYNPWVGQPACGYGLGCGAALQANPYGYYSQGGLNPYAYQGGFGQIPPPQQFVPPHAQSGGMNMGLNMGLNAGNVGINGSFGGGLSGYPYNYGYANALNPYLSQQFMMPQSSNNMGPTIIDMRNQYEWEKNDSGSIVLAAGIGMGMQATNVFPVFPPRNAPTLIPPFWSSSGSKNIGFEPRPTH